MGDSFDALPALARAIPGVASASPHATAEAALSVRLLPGADSADIGAAVGRLLLAALEPAWETAWEPAPPTEAATGAASPGTVAVPEPRQARPHVVRLDVHSDGPVITVGVGLSCDGQAGQGSARSALTTTGVRRAMAAATLHAIEALCPQPVHLELDLVERSDAGQTPVVLVHVTLVSPQGVQRLVGSATVHDDEGRAVVRAALDAVNRRIDGLLRSEGQQAPPAGFVCTVALDRIEGATEERDERGSARRRRP